MLTMTSFVHGVTSVTLTNPEMRHSEMQVWGARKLTINTETGMIEINLFAPNTECLQLAGERAPAPEAAA